METQHTGQTELIIQMNGIVVASIRDPDVHVLEGVNWTVARGDFWVVAGLHGSGKTDFMLMTAGLTAPRGGTYHLFGEEMPIFEEPLLQKRLKVALVFD